MNSVVFDKSLDVAYDPDNFRKPWKSGQQIYDSVIFFHCHILTDLLSSIVLVSCCFESAGIDSALGQLPEDCESHVGPFHQNSWYERADDGISREAQSAGLSFVGTIFHFS